MMTEGTSGFAVGLNLFNNDLSVVRTLRAVAGILAMLMLHGQSALVRCS